MDSFGLYVLRGAFFHTKWWWWWWCWCVWAHNEWLRAQLIFTCLNCFWCEEVHKPKKILQVKRSKGSGNKILRTHDDTKSGTHNLLTSCIPIKFYRFSAVTYFDSDFEFIVIKKTAHTKSVANTSRLKKKKRNPFDWTEFEVSCHMILMLKWSFSSSFSFSEYMSWSLVLSTKSTCEWTTCKLILKLRFAMFGISHLAFGKWTFLASEWKVVRQEISNEN